MLAAIAVSAALSGAALFGDPELAAALGGMHPAPGAWVEYLIRSRGAGDARVRVTALAEGAGGGYWLEVATVHESGIAGAARLLVRGDDGSAIERMSVMVAGQQPLEIPLERLGPALPAPRAIPRVQRLGSARVRVAAGAFAAEVSRAADATVWRAAGVPLWGLVKARSRRRSIELLAFGASGGRSVFPAGRDHGNGSDSEK
ncbi:MAG TPA: hypothetical protein VFA79_20660 [Myxococcales bacterium]|nr:hypothetical protein [Myxococcales bacterium]